MAKKRINELADVSGVIDLSTSYLAIEQYDGSSYTTVRIPGDAVGGGSGIVDLSTVLSSGNTTGGSDIILDTGDSISGSTSDKIGYISSPTNLLTIGDVGSFSGLFMNTSSNFMILSMGMGRVIDFNTSNTISITNTDGSTIINTGGNTNLEINDTNVNITSDDVVIYSSTRIQNSSTGDVTGIVINDTKTLLQTTYDTYLEIDISLSTDKIFKVIGLPIFSDNASAITGGLNTNDIYKTSTGEVRIVV